MESLVGTFDPAFFEKKRSQPTGDIITRPFTCIAVNQEKSEVLVGSADHAAYTFSAENGSGKRRLYHRSFGHREWVSSCCFLPDGRPLTGGQDGKLCLWSKGGASCRDLPGKQHSVSQCSPVADNVAVSSGYDGSLVVWNLVGSSPICVKIEVNYF